MGLRMEGKVALVTGGGGGIGSAVGGLFCAEGASVILVDHDKEALIRVSAHIRERTKGAAVDIFVGDVAVEEEARQAVALAISRFGRLNVVVNNAAIRDVHSIEETERKTGMLCLRSTCSVR